MGERFTASSLLDMVERRLPAVVFKLRRIAPQTLKFSHVGQGCRALWGVKASAARADASTLLDTLSCTDRSAFVHGIENLPDTQTVYHWEGTCTVDGARRCIGAMMRRLNSAQARHPAWSGLFYDATARRANDASLSHTVAELQDALASEQLRSSALEATCRALRQGSEAEGVAWMREQDKAASLNQLAAGVAHELNNPLAGVMVMFEALHGGSLTESQRRDYTDAITCGLTRMQLAVAQVLRYAQPAFPEMQPCRWDAIFRTAHARLAGELRSRQQSMQTSELSHCVSGDFSSLVESLCQVLRNAIDVTHAGGVIRVRGVRRQGLIGLEVADSGCGIPREYLHRVSDPFFTTKRQGEGAGWGLARASRTLESHGGHLTVESRVGVGTQVVLWLPAQSG